MKTESKNIQLHHRGNPPGKMSTLGICLGASTISIVRLEIEKDIVKKTQQTPKIVDHLLFPHEGNPKQTLIRALSSINIDSLDKIAATGRMFRKFVNLTSISEPEAVEYAYRHVKPDNISCPAIVSAGGETFMTYVLNKSGEISNVLTGNKCASGTGEFFLQQLRRMDVTLDEAMQWAVSEKPYHVSGRCSVFCKSDCTHATNKGILKSEVTAGLCRMMANKILELLKKINRKNIMITGGTALNKMMIEYLGKEIEGLIVPREAPYFEALGAALWAVEHETLPFPGRSGLFRTDAVSFDTLSPLSNYSHMVEFKTISMDRLQPKDKCVLGLDVGSTTTKAVLVRNTDDAMVASIYLRTNGDPVRASRECYRSILKQVKAQVNPDEISIRGLGVCGSGRQIAGLHAMTYGVINEIIAHAAAAVYFDRHVDTIFEIGGQDAKYTYITNGVPSDYAMNEACSAGTGSFLEESALETLGVEMEDIAGIALGSKTPPNFNDQCAAFISSDIKTAIHEGIQQEDIVAGLVYSICMNYANRVKGNRPVGEKVFMQGGVCYNKAIPLAMAALIGKKIIVPPEPGLMGAYGVALEIKNRIKNNTLKEDTFDLEVLMNRGVKYGKAFICKGGKDNCDRRCKIAIIELEGKKHPFGGACNRYYNLRHNLTFDIEKLDLVRKRQNLLFKKYSPAFLEDEKENIRGRIGINRSFLVNSYFPLYSTFFSELGFKPVIPKVASQEGIDQRNAAFCYPGELAHGFFYSLIQTHPLPDYIFLPHFKATPSMIKSLGSQVCPLVQGETFYLKSTFHKNLKKQGFTDNKLLSPLLNLSQGLDSIEKPMVETGTKMGFNKNKATSAFRKALFQQKNFEAEIKKIGLNFLQKLEDNPDKIGIVLFGRPYNAFANEAHMGIPHKLASRGVLVLPMDFLPFEKERAKRYMYWGMGQVILKAARFVKKHPQLFGTYITNFSCGPDSFIIGYFRNIMGRKPSLTLELDSHTADAGLETRIEAFLDIILAYRHLHTEKSLPSKTKKFVISKTVFGNGVPKVITSSGEELPMNDPRVTLLFPSMGKLATESIASIFKGAGFNAKAHPPADEAILKLGRGNTSCKECLPLILTTGTLLHYIKNGRRKNEILVYFMPTGAGPCRFGQYHIFMEDLIKKHKIENVAMFSLTGENAYAGMDRTLNRKGWWSIVVSDIMEDIRSMLLANSKNPEKALEVFDEEWSQILSQLETGNFDALETKLSNTAERFKSIQLKRPPKEVPIISLTGEIFVRRDALSRQYLTERLARLGFACICSPIAEWLNYSDYLVAHQISSHRMSITEKLKFFMKKNMMNRYQNKIKSALCRSGLVTGESIDIKKVIQTGQPYISHYLTGEAILTVGSSLLDIASHVCGVIAIGPFGCMPNRFSEAILTDKMNRKTKLKSDPNNQRLQAVLRNTEDLPFLAIESDGSPFPQMINAKLETFCLRAERLHEKMRSVKK